MNSLMFLKLELGGQVPPALWEPGRSPVFFRLGPYLDGLTIASGGVAFRIGELLFGEAAHSYS